MSVVPELIGDVVGTLRRGLVRRAVRALPPVDTPGLDPDLARVARVYQLAQQPWQPVASLRLGYELDARLWEGTLPDGVATTDEQLPLPADPSGPDRAVRVRTYTPSHPTGGALVYFHGGGFTIGSLASHDGVCRRLAAGAGVVVHAVDYRLAPEHPFPAGLTDACAAWRVLRDRWVAEGGVPVRIGVGGDSAGGHCAATICDEAVEPTLGVEVPVPGFALLIYPGVHLARPAAAYAGVLPGPALLSAGMVERFAGWHAPTDAVDRQAPALNPLLRDEQVLAGHPRTWVQTVGLDPLLPEDLEYVERLRAAGVDVTHVHEETLAHAYITMSGVSPAAAAGLNRCVAALRRLTAAG